MLQDRLELLEDIKFLKLEHFGYRYELRTINWFEDDERGETTSDNIIFPEIGNVNVTPLQIFERQVLNPIFEKFDETILGNWTYKKRKSIQKSI